MPTKAKTAKKPALRNADAAPKKAAKTQKFFRTGEKCPESGLWEHFCKEKGDQSKIPLSKTETFPPCRTCGSVKWTLVMSAN